MTLSHTESRPASAAVILARGLGTRMRKANPAASLNRDQSAMADAGIKGLVNVGRPFLDFVLSSLADAGFVSVCLVIGPEHTVLRDYYIGRGKPRRLRLEIAIQEQPLGTANAVLAAESFASDEAFVVLNSDNYYPASALDTLRHVRAPAIAGFWRTALIDRGNIDRAHAARFGALEADAEGFLTRILVGPDAANKPDTEALANMNCWLFDSRIFEACRKVPFSARGEYELPQAVRLGIETLGMKVRVVQMDAAVLDLSSRDDIASVTRLLEGVEVRV